MRVGFRARQTAQPFTWSSGPVAFQQGLCPLRAEDLAPGRYAVTSVPREPSGLSRDRGGDGRGPISTGFPAHQGRVLVDPRVSRHFQRAGTKLNPRLEAWEACAASSQWSVCPGGNSP